MGGDYSGVIHRREAFTFYQHGKHPLSPPPKTIERFLGEEKDSAKSFPPCGI